MERISTGIKGLDSLIQGYPKGRAMLVTGESGAGKTIFGLQFLTACCEAGVTCVYITMEERPEDLKAQAMSFGWDLADYEQKGLLRIVDILKQRMERVETTVTPLEERQYQNLLRIVAEIYEERRLCALPISHAHKGTRARPDVVIIDNIGVATMEIPPHELRKQLDPLIYQLSGLGCTSLIISDDAVAKISNDLMLYAVYGAIRLQKRDNPYTSRRERVMDIIKLRNTKIPLDYLLFDITDKGIELIVKSED
ncbi:MAG: ATPase domain-containing protein [Euryarchaeota archaeon]|nr:ATPase domain-containing protein [Euryarchaeota archaeon]